VVDGKKPVSEVPFEATHPTTIGQKAAVDVPPEALKRVDPKNLGVRVTDPSGKEIPCQIAVNESKPQVTFVPTQPGEHITEFYKGDPTNGDKIGQIPVEAKAPQTVAGCPAKIDLPVVAENSKPDTLRAVVKDPEGNIVPSQIITKEDGKPQLSFVPKQPGNFVVDIFAGPEKVASIPVEAVGTTEVAKPTSVAVPLTGPILDDTLVIVKDPSGKEIPSTLEPGKSGESPKVTFTPLVPGIFKAEMYSGGEHIGDVPIKAEPSKVTVSEPATLSIPNADLGVDNPEDIKIIVKDPSGKEVPSKITLKDGEPQLSFVPQQAGPHVLEVFKGDDPVKISEIPIDASPSVDVGSPVSLDIPPECILSVEEPENLCAYVTDPAGDEVPAQLEIVDGKPKLTFVPVVPGMCPPFVELKNI
jgi:hypothetical protein